MSKDKNNYSEEYVKKNRTFPTANTVWLVICIILQISALVFAILYTPQPQDLIKEYKITVEPLDDGKLEIEYSFVWQALDEDEPLTWVEIGMPNRNYTVVDNSVSDTVSRYLRVADSDYVALRLDFTRAYSGGETVEFSFKTIQSDMLCREGMRYFYEFVPGWFNRIPIEKYEFRWKQTEGCTYAEKAQKEDGYYVWSGSFDCGGYQMMYVEYSADAFDGANTVVHYPFDDSGAYDELKGDKGGAVALSVLIIIMLIVPEVFIIDSYVSYNRGRGFLTGYGHRVHIYGRSNPRYIRERDLHNASHGGGRSGGRGCACACACACAGGGRAGCSQKDGISITKKDEKEKV